MIHRFKNVLKIALGLFILLNSALTHAATDTWTGGGPGVGGTDLNTNANWSTGIVPAAGSQAVFNGALSLAPTATAAFSPDSILFSGLAQYNILVTGGGSIAIGTVDGIQNTTGLTQSITLTGGNTIIFSAPGAPIGNNMVYNNLGGTINLPSGNSGDAAVNLTGGATLNVSDNTTIGALNAGANTFINLSTGTLTFGDATDAVITASTFNALGVGALTKTGSGTVSFNGQANNTGITTILEGTFITNAFSMQPATGGISVAAGATIQFDQSLSAPTTYPYTIQGAGTLYKTGSIPLTLTAPSTNSGGTIIGNTGVGGGTLALSGIGSLLSTAPIAVNNGTLDISQVASGSVTLGTLSGTTIGGTIALGPTNLTINQGSNQVYAGVISNNAIVGPTTGTFTLGNLSVGTLTLTGDSHLFTAGVIINGGSLNVLGQLGGPITINNGGTLSGLGSVGTTGQALTVANGGTLTGGSAIGLVAVPGSLTLPGDLIVQSGATVTLGMNGTVFDTFDVGGTTNLSSGSTVNLSSSNGEVNFNQALVFLTSTGAITGEFGGVTETGFNGNTSLYTATLGYPDANHVTVTIQSTLINAATTSNETAVALQFDGITNATPAQNLLLSQIVDLTTTANATEVLNEASGEQYATSFFIAEVANRRFIRHLYDPLRPLVTMEVSSECCSETSDLCELLDVDLWLSGGGGQSRVSHTSGLSTSEWDINFGAQRLFSSNMTLGMAGAYEHDIVHYHLGGHGSVKTWFGGIYGLYRPACYYVLADLAYGNSRNSVYRPVVIDSTLDVMTSSPIFSQYTFYAEAGFDYKFCSYLIQPFAGVEVAAYHARKFTERTVSELGLVVGKKVRTVTTTSLGLHFNDYCGMGFSISLDLAWLHRFSTNKDITARFASFGTDFTVDGPSVGRNSGEGSLTFSEEFCDGWNIFAEASGEIWDNAYSYSFIGGLQTRW